MISVIQFTEDNLDIPGLCRCGKGMCGLHVHTESGYQIVCPGDLIVDGVVYHKVDERKVN